MKELFLEYEDALALKELGFDEPCLAGFFHYVSDNPEKARQLLTPKDSIFGENYMFKNSVDFIEQLSMAVNHHPICNKNCSAPLYQQAFKFFREKYNLHSYITCSCTVNEILSYDWVIHKLMNNGKNKDENFITDYEQTFKKAELECLKKLIKLAKNEL